jgi:hypothetical protein
MVNLPEKSRIRVFKIINAEILISVSLALESQKEDTQSSFPLNETLTLRDASNTFDDSIAAVKFASVGGLPARQRGEDRRSADKRLVVPL